MSRSRRPRYIDAMLDGLIRPRIDPALDALGRRMAARGVGADAVTLAGLALGLAAAGAIALGHTAAGLVLILASRLADGLDGAVARAGRPTDFGGLLDIVADFLFYGAIPFAFALLDPAANAVAAAALILSFYVNGATFLGVATLAAKRGLGPGDRGPKALHYSAGLLEGTETIAFFVALCLWPAAFAPLAWGFAALCLATAGLRMAAARVAFAETGRRAGR
jgi:phosphatidylglycerophosphate synthase